MPTKHPKPAVATGGVIGFEVLPEACIAIVLSFTSPEDACRLSLVASTFYFASQSDTVWERFLPPDYRDIISRSGNAADLLASTSKMDLYFRLCDNPILIDDGIKTFSLEKKSGKKCYMLAARSPQIVWSGDKPIYMQCNPFLESRFCEAAVVPLVRDVSWVVICGKINSSMLSPNTNYAAYLVFALAPGAYSFDFTCMPAEASIKINGQKVQTRVLCLDRSSNVLELRYNFVPVLPKERSDKWMEVELGTFFVKSGWDAEIAMCLMQIDGLAGGLIVQGIEVRPMVRPRWIGEPI